MNTDTRATCPTNNGKDLEAWEDRLTLKRVTIYLAHPHDARIVVLRDRAEEDYVLVPKSPTQKMLDAGWADAHEEDAAGVWAAMIAASQLPE